MNTQPTPLLFRKAAVGVLLIALAATSCSQGDAGDTIASPTTSAAPPIETTVAPEQPFDATATAVEFMAAIKAHIEAKITGDDGATALGEAASLIDQTGVTIDTATVAACFDRRTADTKATVSDVYELTFEGFNEFAVNPELSIVAFRSVEVVPGVSDNTTFHAVYVSPSGVIGDRPAEDSCWEGALTRNELTAAAFAAALAADSEGVEAADDVATVAQDGGTEQASGTDVWARRDGFAADPNDPEPIRSTGSNKWDIVQTTDPSAFSCIAYLGQGPEQILDREKSEYEDVPDAHLFVARFDDGTSIDIRVHPEIGDLDAVRAEVDRYLAPLGQLPTALRRDIGRFAIRLGDETATASFMEGISMQSGNVSTRLASNRLEETLFHEAVHTSLDHLYAYQRSAEWLKAQELDVRFLTEYGRDNPDSEDLAESALYAYAVLHYPERLTDADVAMIQARIPNRIDFIRTLLPPGESIFSTVAPGQGC